MGSHRLYALALGACFISSTAALAQTPSGDTFCGLYKQAAEQGSQAFVDLRGAEISDGRWQVRDVSVPNGKCLLRSDPEKAEVLACTIDQESEQEARNWAADMTKASRDCLSALTGFSEKAKNSDEDGAKVERTNWVRKTDSGSLNISVATIVRDGKAQNRMQIRINQKKD
jgi:hypothetical protein